MYNPNVIGGRLFVQGLTYNDDRVIEKWVVGRGITTVADNMRHFRYTNNTQTPVANQYINTIYVSKGFYINGMPFEVGGVYRHHQDVAFSYLADFLDNFHVAIGQENTVPSEENIFRATVGENKTSVIGQDGEIFWQSLHLHFKHQLLDEWKTEKMPNLSYKLTMRLPLTEQTFDIFGFSASIAMSKIFGDRFYVIASANMSYQDMNRQHFNSTDPLLVINRFHGDIFVGVTVDFAKIGGWYITLGHRISSRRIYYIHKNRDEKIREIKGAQIEYIKLSYLHNKQNLEFNFSIQEDLIFSFAVTEPDFLLHGSVIIYGF